MTAVALTLRCPYPGLRPFEAEESELRGLGAARVVLAEREVGNELVRHALRRFGVSDREVAALLESRRRS